MNGGGRDGGCANEADRRDWQGLYRRLECVIYNIDPQKRRN